MTWPTLAGLVAAAALARQPARAPAEVRQRVHRRLLAGPWPQPEPDLPPPSLFDEEARD